MKNKRIILDTLPQRQGFSPGDMGPDYQGYKKGGPVAPLGTGERFRKLSSELGKKGASNPDALAAYIGRKKYGAKKMAQLSKEGRKRGK